MKSRFLAPCLLFALSLAAQNPAPAQTSAPLSAAAPDRIRGLASDGNNGIHVEGAVEAGVVAATETIARTIDKGGAVYNVEAFLGKADALPAHDVYIPFHLSAGSSQLSVTDWKNQAPPAPGQYLVLNNDGNSWQGAPPFATAPYVARVVAVSGLSVTMDRQATSTTTGYLTWGTDNTPPAVACEQAAAAAGGGICKFGPGQWLFASSSGYVLSGASDDGSYGTPAGGSGAAIAPVVAGGQIVDWHVLSGGSGYTANSQLQIQFTGGCGAVGWDYGPCGWAYALARTDGRGVVTSVKTVYPGQNLLSTPVAKVVPLGGDGAAAQAMVAAGGSVNTPRMTAAGSGYAPNNALRWWALVGSSGCAAYQTWGGTAIAGSGTVATDADGHASGMVTVNHAPAGCASAPGIVFGPAACNTGTAANPVWGQCANVAPLTPTKFPVQIPLMEGVSWQGSAAASLQGTTLLSVWDGVSVDNNQPWLFGGTVENEDIGELAMDHQFVGLGVTNNLNYALVHDINFGGGIGIWSETTDLDAKFRHLQFGGYASWINGGLWSQRFDFPSEGGGFFDANEIKFVAARLHAYNQTSAALDDWFATNFWHPEFSAASTDLPESCQFPQAPSQRQTGHILGDPHTGNSMCYHGVSSIGMAIYSHHNRPTGNAVFENLIGKQISRYLFYGDAGALMASNWSCERCGGLAQDPYRAAPMQEGAIVFADQGSSQGGGQAWFNNVSWFNRPVECTFFSIAAQSCDPLRFTSVGWNSMVNNFAQAAQPTQNPGYTAEIHFPRGLDVDVSQGRSQPLNFWDWNRGTRVLAGRMQAQQGGVHIYGEDGKTDVLDLNADRIDANVAPYFRAAPHICNPAQPGSCVSVAYAGAGNATLTLPAANSSAVQPLAAPVPGQFLQYIDAAGVQHMGRPGGGPAGPSGPVGPASRPASPVSSGLCNGSTAPCHLLLTNVGSCSASTLLLPPSTGLYRITFYLTVTTAGSGNLQPALVWNDGQARRSVLANAPLNSTSNYVESTTALLATAGSAITYNPACAAGAPAGARWTVSLAVEPL